jgi:hypothetical protein
VVRLSNHRELVGVVSLSNHTALSPFAIRQAQGFRAAVRFNTAYAATIDAAYLARAYTGPGLA